MSILDNVLKGAKAPPTEVSKPATDIYDWIPGRYVKRKCSNGRTYVLRLEIKENATSYWLSKVVISPGGQSSFRAGADYTLDEANEINVLIPIGAKVARVNSTPDLFYFMHGDILKSAWHQGKIARSTFMDKSIEEFVGNKSNVATLVDPPDWLLLKLC